MGLREAEGCQILNAQPSPGTEKQNLPDVWKVRHNVGILWDYLFELDRVDIPLLDGEEAFPARLITGFSSLCGSDDRKVESGLSLSFARENAIHTKKGLFVDSETFRGDDVHQ